MQKKYIVALLVAGFLFAGLLGCARLLRQSFLADFRQSLREQKESGTLPEELQDIDIESATPEGWDTELSASTMQKFERAELIEMFWYVWLFVLTLTCCGAAALFPSATE